MYKLTASTLITVLLLAVHAVDDGWEDVEEEAEDWQLEASGAAAAEAAAVPAAIVQQVVSRDLPLAVSLLMERGRKGAKWGGALQRIYDASIHL